MDRGGRPANPSPRPRPERQEKPRCPWINLSALWKILVFGLLAGAGLPALFAIGLRAAGHARQPGADRGRRFDHVYGGNVLGLVIAAICFLIILAALGWGIYEVYQIGHPAPAKH